MSVEPCPTEEALYAVAAGESGIFADHIAQCELCRTHLRKLQVESTIFRHLRDMGSGDQPPSSAMNWPGSIGKFIIVGVWDEVPAFITYRGLHSVVRREVLIQVSKTRLPEGPEIQSFLAAAGRWMQPRPHLAEVLDAGIFQTRPYLVIAFQDGVPLDRLVREGELDCGALIRIWGLIAQSLAEQPQTPHESLTAASLVVDADHVPTLIDWAATAEFRHGPGCTDPDSSMTTSRRLALLCCETILGRELLPTSLSPVSSENDLVRDLVAREAPPAVARFLAKTVAAETARSPSLIRIAHALRPSKSSALWRRIVGR